ncbi:MAG: HEAT repeat domain-containing protein [Bacteroidota bacterium]
MIGWIDTTAGWILTGIVVGLGVLTFLAIALVLIIRYRLHWIEARKETIRARFSDLVIQYLSGDLSLETIQQQARRKIDYISLMEVIVPLGSSLDGEEEDRLQALMGIEGIRSHYRHRLHHGNMNEQAKACLYFARLESLPESMLPFLVRMANVGTPHRRYAAAHAVMIHGALEQKKEVLHRMIRYPLLSSMATIDLVINFTRHGEEYHKEEMAFLTDQICSSDLPDERKALLVQALGELGYFHSLPVLLPFFFTLDPDGTHPDLQVAMIRIMTEFGAEEIVPELQKWGVNSRFADVRIATAAALGSFHSEESVALLKWMVNDPDFRVVQEAAGCLARIPGMNLDEIPSHSLDEDEWDHLKGEIQPDPETDEGEDA